MADVRQTREWQLLVAQAKVTYPWLCHLCQQAIPTDVDWRHPLAYQADHVLTVRARPDLALVLANVRPSHRRCNTARKQRPLTPGLILEFTQRYEEKKPRARDFFN